MLWCKPQLALSFAQRWHLRSWVDVVWLVLVGAARVLALLLVLCMPLAQSATPVASRVCNSSFSWSLLYAGA